MQSVEQTGSPPVKIAGDDRSRVPIPSAGAPVWYLGLDIGTSGLSAVLLNVTSRSLYPVYWTEHPSSTHRFRLPSTFFYPDAAGIAVNHFKPLLQSAVPQWSADTYSWEPMVQWSDHQEIPLHAVVQALRSLLATLLGQQSSQLPNTNCGAVGLSQQQTAEAIAHLSGVIVGHPTGWVEPYQTNLREAILAAGLVADASQIEFMEDAIAALLSGILGEDGQMVSFPPDLSQTPHLYNTACKGNVLTICAGASVTDLALVQLPKPLTDLTLNAIHQRGVAYGGDALDQDIISHLIYPAWLKQHAEGTAPTANLWATLGLNDLTLPSVGDVESDKRQRLRQRLLSSQLGQDLLQAATHAKLTLQTQDHLTLTLADQSVRLTRQDLGSRVFLPYIQRLNREVNALLLSEQRSTADIHYVICTGGTASLGAIARWLREKLPNATIIQDTYAHHPGDRWVATCSRVAYGLATLPLNPQLIRSGAMGEMLT